MYCSNCGKEIEEGSNFCKNCGQKIGENSSDNKNNKGKKQASPLNWMIAIICIIFAVWTISSIMKEIDQNSKNMSKQIDRMSNLISFNCPYCKKYVEIDKRTLSDYGSHYSSLCPNCRKLLEIDKNTTTVTVRN